MKNKDVKLNTDERERSILASLDVGIVIHAPNTSIIFSNPRASEILGLTEDQLKGKMATSPDWNFLREDNTPLLFEDYPVNKIIVNKKPIKNILLGINRPTTNDIRWVNVSGIPIFDDNGELTEIIVSFSDITNRKEIENDLRLSKIAAENASLLKSRFLDIAAHELRTPVTSFSLLLQLTQRQLEKGLPFEASILTRLRAQADKISHLVVDLLDVSRLERGSVKLHLERIDILPVITDCVDDLKLREPDRRIKIITPKTPVEFNFDSLRISQVISNILENARKYTPEQSPIEITVETKPNRVRISIADQGPGISDEQKTKLFNPFSRGSDELISRSGGLGLGLYICSEIIKLHGGTIGVISKMGEGSTFYFELPTREEK